MLNILLSQQIFKASTSSNNNTLLQSAYGGKGYQAGLATNGKKLYNNKHPLNILTEQILDAKHNTKHSRQQTC